MRIETIKHPRYDGWFVSRIIGKDGKEIYAGSIEKSVEEAEDSLEKNFTYFLVVANQRDIPGEEQGVQ